MYSQGLSWFVFNDPLIGYPNIWSAPHFVRLSFKKGGLPTAGKGSGSGRGEQREALILLSFFPLPRI